MITRRFDNRSTRYLILNNDLEAEIILSDGVRHAQFTFFHFRFLLQTLSDDHQSSG